MPPGKVGRWRGSRATCDLGFSHAPGLSGLPESRLSGDSRSRGLPNRRR
jgi:hypothetical protein